jgi:hypothetical protein
VNERRELAAGRCFPAAARPCSGRRLEERDHIGQEGPISATTAHIAIQPAAGATDSRVNGILLRFSLFRPFFRVRSSKIGLRSAA